MENIDDLMDLVGDKLTEITTSELVVGPPTTLGNVKIVPLSRINVGFGGGGGDGEYKWKSRGKKSKNIKLNDKIDVGKSAGGKGKGSGGGGCIRPVAVVVFAENGVEVLKIPEPKKTVNSIFEKMPGIFNKFKKNNKEEEKK